MGVCVTVCVYVYMYVYSMLCGGMQSQALHSMCYNLLLLLLLLPPMIPSQRRTYMFLDLSLCAAVRAARSTIRVRLFGSMHPTKNTEHGSRTAHPNIVKQLDKSQPVA